MSDVAHERHGDERERRAEERRPALAARHEAEGRPHRRVPPAEVVDHPPEERQVRRHAEHGAEPGLPSERDEGHERDGLRRAEAAHEERIAVGEAPDRGQGSAGDADAPAPREHPHQREPPGGEQREGDRHEAPRAEQQRPAAGEGGRLGLRARLGVADPRRDAADEGVGEPGRGEVVDLGDERASGVRRGRRADIGGRRPRRHPLARPRPRVQLRDRLAGLGRAARLAENDRAMQLGEGRVGLLDELGVPVARRGERVFVAGQRAIEPPLPARTAAHRRAEVQLARHEALERFRRVLELGEGGHARLDERPPEEPDVQDGDDRADDGDEGRERPAGRRRPLGRG